jgi:hypothetical protein
VQGQCKNVIPSVSNSRLPHNCRIWFAVRMLMVTGALAVLCGCTAMPLKRFKPVIAPPPGICKPGSTSLLAGEPPDTFHYVSPGKPNDPDIKPFPKTFEEYYGAVQKNVQKNMPTELADSKVTLAFMKYFTTVSGQAQLDAQISVGRLDKVKDSALIASEQKAIDRHRPPKKLTHGEMKDFADKLFDLQLKPGATELTKPDKRAMLVAYFQAYYKGTFVDRMGTTEDKPKIGTTIPDAEITAAETVLLELLIDSIDPTPILGGDPPSSVNPGSTNFYPGGTTAVPTSYSFNPAKYVQIPAGSEDACGITQQNIWVLRDIVNGASNQAGAVGGLVVDTWGGATAGIAVLNLKFSVGDNQTLSVMVTTAASRLALRLALASGYKTLQYVRFNVPEPNN